MSRVSADREICIQSGNCVMVAGDVFDQDDDGIVVLLVEDVPPAEQDNARKAVQLCPSGALNIVE